MDVYKPTYESLRKLEPYLNKGCVIAFNQFNHKDWPGDIPKKIKRYKQFRGEHIFIFVGSVNKYIKFTSDEGDEWKGKSSSWFLPIKKVIKLTEQQELIQPIEDMAFRACQKSILSTLLYTHYKP